MPGAAWEDRRQHAISFALSSDMIVATKNKIALASIAYRTIAFGRSLIGKNDSAVVRRGGFYWDLDLKEGIDFSIYLLGAFEKSTVVALQKLVGAGDIVIDIGANIGAHTLSLARSTGPNGRVFAVEPTDFAFAKLKRNIELNRQVAGWIDAHQVELAGDDQAPRQPEIYASWPLRAEGSVHPKHRGRLAATRRATIATLDTFVLQTGIDRLNLIKIDVDGHEYPVLKGATRTLTRFRPILVMEMSPYIHAEENYSFDELIDLMRESGYCLKDSDSWKPVPLDAGELRALIPDGSSINVVAIPDGN